MGGAGLGDVSVFQDLGFLPPFLLWAWAEIPQGSLGWVVSGIWGSLGEHQGAVTYRPIWGWGGAEQFWKSNWLPPSREQASRVSGCIDSRREVSDPPV